MRYNLKSVEAESMKRQQRRSGETENGSGSGPHDPGNDQKNINQLLLTPPAVRSTTSILH